MNPKGIVLYRRLTPGGIEFNELFGNSGTTWSYDLAYEATGIEPDRYILEAVLHPSAKRLVLVTEPDEEGFYDHNPEGIKKLAEIVGDPLIYDDFMKRGGHLWDLWEPEWTKAVKDAGYDTICTGNFDGFTEEYVLNPNKLQFIRYYRVLARDQFEQHPVEDGTLESLGYVVGLETAV